MNALARRGWCLWGCVSVAVATPMVIGCAGGEAHDAAAERSNVSAGDVDITKAEKAYVDAMAKPGEWVEYGRDYTNQRWSPLAQITPTNVGQLAPAWINHSGIAHASETGPVVVDGVMYFTTALNHVIALDAATGDKKWEYAYDYGGHTVADCCASNNKGVAVYGGRVFMATVDARLVALAASTGKELWRVQVGDNDLGYHMTGAPTVVDGRVITGVSGGEQGCRCYVDAYDVNTGNRLWRFYTIPSPGQGGWWGKWRTQDDWGMSFNRDIAKEKADSAKYADAWKTGGGGVWTTPAYDKASNTIFATVGNPSPDLDGSVRPGDNLFTDGMVAIDATTGKTKWYYQTVPHDVWDLDATSPSVVTELGGRKVVVHAGKTGWLYVVDAATGKLVRKSQNFVPHENMFALPTEKGTRMLPGANGGSEWSPISVSPKLGYAFVAGLHQPMNYITHTAPWEKGRLWLGSAFVAIPGEEQYGLFSAIDLKTGKLAWQNKVPQPMMGGSLSTAGGLTFTGEGNGNFNAYDSRTGKLLWQFNGGAGCNSTPISFELDGEQFIAEACGGNFQLSYRLGDAILVFGLPKAPAAR